MTNRRLHPVEVSNQDSSGSLPDAGVPAEPLVGCCNATSACRLPYEGEKEGGLTLAVLLWLLEIDPENGVSFLVVTG